MCCHYWKVDSRNYGICSLCQEERQFHPELATPFNEGNRKWYKLQQDDIARLARAQELVYESEHRPLGPFHAD